MKQTTTKGGRILVWSIVVALFVLHQDFWWWDDKTLILGFLPVGLFYHVVFSLAAGLTWAMANKLAWPVEIEEWAEGGGSTDSRPTAEQEGR